MSLLAGLVLGQSAGIDDVWQTGLKDVSFRTKVGKAVQKELQKINKDFATSYRFDYTDVKMKEPMKLRVESVVEGTSLLYIVNGTDRLFSMRGIKQREDLSKSPGKRQTAFDFGLLPKSLFDEYLVAKFVRIDRRSNEPVFDLTYNPKTGDTARHRVWVDRTRKFVTRREWYSQAGNLMATFVYSNPKEFSGVWLPTRMEVSNAEGKFAGVTDYVNIKVNAGLSDSLFSTK